MLAEKQDVKYEVISGRVVAMSPSASSVHNAISGNLYYELRKCLDRKKCSIFFETKVNFSDEDKLIPDICIVSEDIIGKTNIDGVPDIVMEVLSPGTRKLDLGIKKDQYYHYGVKEYWIADPYSLTIDIYNRGEHAFCCVASFHAGAVHEDETEREKFVKSSVCDRIVIDVDDIFNDLVMKLRKLLEN